jgi:hypothetical protein
MSDDATPLRLVVFDPTDVGRFSGDSGGADGTSRRVLGLSPVWRAGAWLHGVARAADAVVGARSWDEALAWATEVSRARRRPVGSLQAWGHGGWGHMQLGESSLDRRALRREHALAARLDAFRAALAPDALLWLRCCSAFGHDGRLFARELADRLGARVAGHSFVIGFFQSGTHALSPGAEPDWDPAEGVRFEGDKPAGALGSGPFAPSTITCLTSDLPAWASRRA